jgi:hypothetical protein
LVSVTGVNAADGGSTCSEAELATGKFSGELADADGQAESGGAAVNITVKRRLAVLAAIVPILVAPIAAAGFAPAAAATGPALDWTQYLHDPQHSSVSPATGVHHIERRIGAPDVALATAHDHGQTRAQT